MHNHTHAHKLAHTPCTPQVSEKILGLDEEVRALRLEAAEAEVRAEALVRCGQTAVTRRQAAAGYPPKGGISLTFCSTVPGLARPDNVAIRGAYAGLKNLAPCVQRLH
jgi:hypothetical protein